VKKALLYQRRLGGQIAVVDKRRASAEETKVGHLIGAPLLNKTVIVFDDMISTASSMVNAVDVAKKQGAKKIYVCATHGLLCGPAVDRLRDAQVEQIAVTDSLPMSKEKQDKLPNLKTISVAPLLADAIRRIHGNESVSDLFRDEPAVVR
jgi:ribose-phosphate pyrophosphokinase